MKYTIRMILLIGICLASVMSGYATGKADSLYNKISLVIANKLAARQLENEQLRQQGLPGNYIVIITDKDLQQTIAYPDHVVSLPQQHTNEADVEKLWDFTNNATLKDIPGQLQSFSKEQGYDYYLVICAIYNYFRLDETTDFSNITWTNSDLLKFNGDASSAKYKKTGNNGGYVNLLHYLVKKFRNDPNTPKENAQSHVYHFVMTTYVPYDNGKDNKPTGRLRHFQGLTWTSPNTDTAFDAVWTKFTSSKQAELAGSNNTEQRKASKEEWLAGFVNANQTMLAAIRNTHPDELAAITDKPTLIKKLQDIPEAVFAGFSAALRVQMLRILAKDEMRNDAEKLACALVEQTPVAQVDSVILAMRQANPYIPEIVPSKSSDPLNSTGGTEHNYQVGWCLLRCLTEFVDDKTLGVGGNDNYHRLIKSLTTLSYNSNAFKQKAQALNDAYLDAAGDNDKIPDRVIFYTYNSLWSKVMGTLKYYNYVFDPKVDFSTDYNDTCGLVTKKELFLSYYTPNTEIQKLNLDPFEPIVFENQSDLGLLTDFDETPSTGSVQKPIDHILPAIILKYADDKGSAETITDVTMAAIDVASLATGYGELQAGIQGARKAWVIFDMINAGINITGNLAAYDNPTLKELLTYYNMATGAVALARMGTGAVKSFKGYYNALKAERTAMSATNIRNFLKSLKDAKNDLSALHPDDAEGIKSYLQRLKAEANTRGLSNLEQSVDDALNAMALAAIPKMQNVFFKNLDEFAATFDKAGKVSDAIRSQAFDLYKGGKWAELEQLFKSNGINGNWPPANGGYNIVEGPIKAGQVFDRYGSPLRGWSGTGTPPLGGSYTSPVINGTAYSFGARALELQESGYDLYYEIEVLQDLPFSSQTADVIPWHGQVGGGKQTWWIIDTNPNTGYPYTLTELAEKGLIKITIKSSPSGKYPSLVNTVIQKVK